MKRFKKLSVAFFSFWVVLTFSNAFTGTHKAFSEEPVTNRYYVTIEKSVDRDNVVLKEGETTFLYYTITVNVSSDMPKESVCFLTLEEGQKIFVKDSAIGDITFGDYIRYGNGVKVYTHNYQVKIGPFECQYYGTIENTACLKYNPDPSPNCCVTAVVTINVPCEGSCTLTPGYWKTHSEYGPAPYDNIWAMLSNGADTPFFNTGLSYYEVLASKPKGGNAFFILAHAYIAAELNVLNGASIPAAVLSSWEDAGALLSEYATEAMIPKRSEDRDTAISLAQILDAYNNGYIGPGHCSD